MSLGTGIFLSAMFLGIIALYLGTADRWNWRRLILRTTVGLAVLVAGALALFVWSSRPERVEELWGISPGITRADVRFLKGSPVYATEDDDLWLYAPEGPFAVIFRDESVWFVACFINCAQGPTAANVRGDTTVEELRRTLGEPSYVETAGDDAIRVYVYEPQRLAFELSHGAVGRYGLFDPAVGRPTHDDFLSMEIARLAYITQSIGRKPAP